MSPGETSAGEPSGDGGPGLAARVVRGAGLAGGGYLFAQALNLGVYVVLSRLLVPSDFGQYASATVLIAFGVLITESGMHSAVVQREDRLEEAKSTAVAATFLGGILFSLTALAAAPLIGALFGDSKVTELAAVASGLIFVNSLAVVPNAILQRRFSPIRWTVIDPLEVVAFGIVTIILADQGLGPWALVIGQYAALTTSTVLAWGFARWRPALVLMSYGMWRELAAYGRHILVSTAIFRFGVQTADTVIIGKTLGPASLGQFRYAFRVATLPYTVLLAGAGYVIFPALARISVDRERLRAAFLRSLRWMAVLGVPAGMALIPLGPALTVIAFGDVWEPAGAAAIALCAYSGASAVTATVTELLKADGTPAPLTRINLTITLVTAAAMLALSPLGLSAAAAGLSIGAIAGAGYALLVARRGHGLAFRETAAEIWPAAVAGTVAALLILPLDRLVLEPTEHGLATGLALLAVEGLAYVGVYLAALRLLAPAHSGEILGVLGALRRRRSGPVDLEPAEEASPGRPAP